MQSRRPLASAAFLALALSAPPAFAGGASFGPCPVDTLAITGNVFIRTAAAFDTTSGYYHVGYDLVAGTVVMQQGGSLASTFTDAFDDYDVTGVPAGTPVSLTVLFTVDGDVWTYGCGGTGCSGMYGAWLIHGAQSAEVIHSDHLFTGRTDHHDVLQLPLTIVAGQPERVEFKLLGHRNPGGSHSSDAFGRIGFTGLSEGMSVISCQGFAGSVTPVRRATWGQIKQLYR